MTVTEAKNVVVKRLSGNVFLGEREHRKKLIIQNTDGSNAIYIKFDVTGATVSATAAQHDIQIPAKGTFVLDNYVGPIKASAATVNYTELG